MFRLVFLAFHGTSRARGEHGDAHAGTADHGAGHAAPHGAHGVHLHDAPPAMALALVLLAVGSVAAGYVGVPHLLGGENRIETFLHPSFVAHDSVGEQAQKESSVPESEEHEPAGLELQLMAIS